MTKPPGPPDPPITAGAQGWPSREKLNALVATLGVFEWCEANGLLDAEMGELRRARDAFMVDWGPTAERWREQTGEEPSWSQYAHLIRENVKLRTALSQPEQRGEEAEQIVARIVSRWLINRGAEIRAGQPLTGTPNGIAQEILAALPAQPPTPALSDEKCRCPSIIQSAGPLGYVCEDCGKAWDLDQWTRRSEQAEPAREELTMIALALKNQGIEGVTPERGVELLIERLYAQRQHPPAQEVEGLRERLLDAMANARQGVATAGDGGHGFDSGDLFGADPAAREKAMARGTVVQVVALDDINAALDEVFPPPPPTPRESRGGAATAEHRSAPCTHPHGRAG